MEFKKYQHIERFGTTETEGIADGICYVFPKIDGTNAQLWWNNGLQAGSRKRHLSLDKDNAGFLGWALKQHEFNRFFNDYPNLRLYGEWLVPHTLKTYEQSAYRNFYVFDVMDGDEYLPYNIYYKLIEEYEIEYIPPICVIENPTEDRLINMLQKNYYLIQDGKGVGEGLVIKRYEFTNRFGNTVWAKIVRNDFKAKHAKVQVTKVKEKKIIEQEIANQFVTLALVEKEHAKINNEAGWSSKHIPRLLETVYYCIIKEDSWNIIKNIRTPQ